MRLLSWIVLAVATMLGPGPLAAEEPAPSPVADCADVDMIVRGFAPRKAKKINLASDGSWSEAVIPVATPGGARAFRVRERDIDLFLRCWDAAYRADTMTFAYNQEMPSAIGELFPFGAQVAEALTAYSGRVVPSADGDPPAVLRALTLYAITPLADRRAQLAPTVTAALRDQWWKCWEQRASKYDYDSAASYCNHGYAEAASVWRYGLVVADDEASRQRIEVDLATDLTSTLKTAKDPVQRQIAVLASEQAAWDGRRTLLLLAMKDRDPEVRMMAVRFSGNARLDENGKPYDADLRRALQDLTRRDPDTRVRREANIMLQLPPYLGPG